MQHVRQDWGFYAFIGAYAGFVAFVAFSIGEGHKFVPLIYYPEWTEGLLLALAVLGSLAALRALRHSSPLESLRADFRRVNGPEQRAGLALFMALALFHGVFTSMKTMLPDLAPFSWDPALADLDAAIHGKDPWLWLTFLDPLTYPLQRLYAKSWFILVALVSFAVCVWPRLRHVRAQFIWTFLLCWPLLGNLTAGLFLSGGPIFYKRIVGDDRFTGLTDHLSTLPPDSPINFYPKVLWVAYEQDRSGFGSGISAFPSMHLSMATLFALLAFRTDKRLGYAALAYLALILAGSVHLGWHYAIDGYASIIATVLIWKAAGWAPQPQAEVKTA